MEQLRSQWTDFCEILYSGFLLKSVDAARPVLHSYRNNRHFRCRLAWPTFWCPTVNTSLLRTVDSYRPKCSVTEGKSPRIRYVDCVPFAKTDFVKADVASSDRTAGQQKGYACFALQIGRPTALTTAFSFHLSNTTGPAHSSSLYYSHASVW